MVVLSQHHIQSTASITDLRTTTTMTEELPSIAHSKIRENGTLGVNFKDKHQTCHKSISFPALDQSSMIESSHSNKSQTHTDDNIFQRQEVVHSRPEKKEIGVKSIYMYYMYEFY